MIHRPGLWLISVSDNSIPGLVTNQIFALILNQSFLNRLTTILNHQEIIARRQSLE